MKRIFLSLIISSLFGVFPAQAFFDEVPMEDAPLIEVGVGAAAIGGDAPVEALLKVEFPGLVPFGGSLV
ncbi:hypothetical protein WDW86_17930 [Bdellovibrionota bacterium FG-2]